MCMVRVIDEFNNQKDQMRAEAEKTGLKFEEYRELPMAARVPRA
jgi:hypothetical protein